MTPRSTRIIAGLGFRTAAPIEALAAALAEVEAAAGVRADALAVPRDKAAAPNLRALAAARGLPVLAVAVAGVATPTHSPRVMALRGTGSVAEAAALAAAGDGAVLIAPRKTSPCRRATAALAEAAPP